MKRIVAVLSLWAVGATAAQAQLLDLKTVPPDRLFGYFLGDVLVSRVEIVTAPGWRVVPASFPRPHELDYWLDLRDVREKTEKTRAGGERVTIILTYQSFYAPLEPRRMTIPAFALELTDGTRRVETHSAAWQFLSSPLREISQEKGMDFSRIQPDHLPGRRTTLPEKAGFAGSFLAALFALVVLMRRAALPPFGGRPDRPFATALRGLRRLRDTAEGRIEGMRLVHGAFDATAGYVVMTEDVPGVLRSRPDLAREAAEIDAFFAASREAFFGGGAVSWSVGRLRALCRRLRATGLPS
ncbi:hypothetical protein [Acidomonas methanolica]|uniref:MxaA protein n=2 Tax=Acidomonas methanolica TaxID=437 RepID=A0A023D523_ACIMT|nr:hypothetical protein [Acidomonas methanolica]MBU2655462.1 hypothetical protein [Acidomonas methanolica]TCS24448.1 mxaA protein [Acidomonas methanolica]BAN85793.1 hypothetical protein [Acidomonas methanolica]GAJ29253.1 hypothetical protein Amme_057_010 [Acidomonas methanolica NBRC 104435]GBQ49063.1 MxaA protein involved in Ca2+ insertion in methanol dehydrogenase [Acidomonas methanolica]